MWVGSTWGATAARQGFPRCLHRSPPASTPLPANQWPVCGCASRVAPGGAKRRPGDYSFAELESGSRRIGIPPLSTALRVSRPRPSRCSAGVTRTKVRTRQEAFNVKQQAAAVARGGLFFWSAMGRRCNKPRSNGPGPDLSGPLRVRDKRGDAYSPEWASSEALPPEAAVLIDTTCSSAKRCR